MISLPDPESPFTIADWVELHVAVNQQSVSKTEIGSVVEAVAGEEPAEPLLTDVWRRLIRRSELYEDPPYRMVGGTIEPIPFSLTRVDYHLYLLLSLFGGSDQLSTKLFERVTCGALSEYMNGNAIVIGFPAGPGQPTTIEEKTKYIADRLNEEFSTSPSPRFKDRGLDVVCWKPFNDGRSGQIVLLVQCAAGYNWADKQAVPIDAWIQYIHWAVKPIKAFAVPGIIRDRDWHDRNTDFGLIVDRVRLLNFLHSGVQDVQLKSDVQVWVQQKLKDEMN